MSSIQADGGWRRARQKVYLLWRAGTVPRSHHCNHLLHKLPQNSLPQAHACNRSMGALWRRRRGRRHAYYRRNVAIRAVHSLQECPASRLTDSKQKTTDFDPHTQVDDTISKPHSVDLQENMAELPWEEMFNTFPFCTEHLCMVHSLAHKICRIQHDAHPSNSI